MNNVLYHIVEDARRETRGHTARVERKYRMLISKLLYDVTFRAANARPGPAEKYVMCITLCESTASLAELNCARKKLCLHYSLQFVLFRSHWHKIIFWNSHGLLTNSNCTQSFVHGVWLSRLLRKYEQRIFSCEIFYFQQSLLHPVHPSVFVLKMIFDDTIKIR